METAGLVDVLLPKLGGERQRYEATKLVMELQRGSWEDAKKLVQRAPAVVQPGVEPSKAEECKRLFKTVGVDLMLQPHVAATTDSASVDKATQAWLVTAVVVGLVATYEWIRTDSHQVSFFVKGLLTAVYLLAAGISAYRLERARGNPISKVALRFLGITTSLIFFGFGLLWASLGAISCLSIIGILWGIPMVMLGLVIASPGFALCLPPGVLSRRTSSLFRNVTCPYCETVREVLLGNVSFKCGGCKQRVLIKGGEGVKIA
jgi:hypothetical protein